MAIALACGVRAPGHVGGGVMAHRTKHGLLLITLAAVAYARFLSWSSGPLLRRPGSTPMIT